MPDYFSLSGYNRQYPTRVISGDQILEIGPEQEQTLIGYKLSYCNELETIANEAVSKAEGYYEELVAAGLKVRPKTQDEINAEMLKTIQKLTEKIDKLESGKDEHKRTGGECSENKPKGGTENKRKPANAAASNTGGKTVL